MFVRERNMTVMLLWNFALGTFCIIAVVVIVVKTNYNMNIGYYQ